MFTKNGKSVKPCGSYKLCSIINAESLRENNYIRRPDDMRIDGHTRVMGLLGDPVQHTMSPLIHNELCRIYGMNGVYVPFHTRRDGLADAVRGAYAMNILGLNVTVPHKNEVMKYLVDMDEGAAAIGAVNTLVRVDGGFKGYNTDMMGLSREMDSYGIVLEGKRAVILGAGGAARAVAFMCMDRGAERVYILNRTFEKAEKIALDMNRHFECDAMVPMKLEDYGRLEAECPEDGFVVFQSTSIGLAPDTEAVVIEDESFYRLVGAGVDLIYTPYETEFMRRCRRAGAKAYNGLRMLLYQGVVAYELWNDVSVSDETADAIYAGLEKSVRKNVVLVGFMGCGKSTVGAALAARTGAEFIDMDEYIEKRQGRTIADIFAEDGEEYFRRLETETLEELRMTASHVVIATGGGAPMRSENTDIMRRLGAVVYLRVTPDEVVSRLSGDTTRPLLAEGDVRTRVEELMSLRSDRYEAAADAAIDVSDLKTDEVVDRIEKLVTEL